MRKTIAVYTSEQEKQYQLGIIEGINKVAFENNYNVAIFSTTVKGWGERYNVGELNIFSLPNIKNLAGIISLVDTIKYDDIDDILNKPLFEYAKETNYPLVLVDSLYEGLPSFVSDDTKVIADMIEHLYKVHNCKDIAYMTGVKGHPHAEHRLECFRKAMADNGLEIDENKLYYGDFWYFEGDNFVAKLIEQGKLPDAIACANDHMAYSVYTSLIKRGYKVPNDILVMGYGEDFEIMKYISATRRHTEKLGIEACKGLIKLIDGEKLPLTPQRVICDSKSNHAITCGCKSVDTYAFATKKELGDTVTGGFFSEHNSMNESLVGQKSFKDVFIEINRAFYYIGDVTDVWFCLNADFDMPESSIDEDEVTTSYSDVMDIYYHRSQKNWEEWSYHIDEQKQLTFPTSDMFPLLSDDTIPPASYSFRGLHFLDRCFGYVVVSNGQKLYEQSEAFNLWIKNVVNGIESQRRLQNAMYLYNRMQENAITDVMTGIRNRNGFNIDMPNLIELAKENNQELLMILGDMNGLKYINDSFGHVEGDLALKVSAISLATNNIEGATEMFNYRIGGDEFIKVALGHFTDADIEAFYSSVRTFLNNYNQTSNKPYPIYISMGMYCKKPNDDITLDEMVSIADKIMYENKLNMKKETGFDPKRI